MVSKSVTTIARVFKAKEQVVDQTLQEIKRQSKTSFVT